VRSVLKEILELQYELHAAGEHSVDLVGLRLEPEI